MTSGHNPDEFAMHSLRMGGKTTLAAGEDVSERVIRREGRWTSNPCKAYMLRNTEDWRRAFRKPTVASEGKERKPVKGIVWYRG